MTSPEISSNLVSVIIPTYCRPLEVLRAAQSALTQSWHEVEVLVVSDGPHPETKAMLEGLDPRLRYLELPTNKGPAAARNAGVQASRGQWLTFLDDDDLMVSNKIECQMRLVDPLQPGLMIACRMLYQHGGRADAWPSVPIRAGEDVADYLLRRPSLLGRPGIIPIQTLLLHRSVLDQVPFGTHRDHEDWAWLLEAWHRAGARVVFAWDPLVIYNIDTEGVSRSRRLNWEDSLAWVQRYRGWIGDRAFCSFIATKVALKAKRAGDRRALRMMLMLVLRNRPAPLDLLFLLGVMILPGPVLQRAWRRSLQNGRPPVVASGT